MVSKSFIFTLNNYTPEEEAALKASNEFSYIFFGHEIGPKCGTPHLQGWFITKKTKRITGFKKPPLDMLKRAYIAIKNASDDANTQYCSKEATDLFEKGQKGPGRRSDLQGAVDLVTSQGLVAVAHEMPLVFVKYHRGLEALSSALADKPRDGLTPPQVYWLYGATGTGKTHYVFSKHGDDYDSVRYHQPFYMGYTGKSTVLFDDYRGTIPYAELLCLLDRYKIVINVKNGQKQWSPSIIYITSSLLPQEVYSGVLHKHDNIDQLLRRISKIIFFGIINGSQEKTYYQKDVQKESSYEEEKGFSRTLSGGSWLSQDSKSES